MVDYRLIERIEKHRNKIDGKTTEEIAGMIGMEGVSSHNTPNGRYLGDVLKGMGFSRKQTSRGRVLFKVWRVPIEVRFMDEEDLPA